MSLLALFRNSLQPLTIGQSRYAATVEWTGVIGLYLFALFSLLSIAAAHLALAVMLIAFILSPAAWRSMARQPMFWLCLATLLYILLRTAGAVNEFPEADSTLKHGKGWALLMVFPLTAWWMSRNPTRIPVAISLMLLGFTVGILSTLDPEMLTKILRGYRLGFHFNKAIIFGFHCAVALLAIGIFAPLWLSHMQKKSLLQKILLTTAIAIAVLFFAQGLILSKSRGVWLSLILTIPFVLATAYLYRTHHRPARSGLGPLAIMLVAAAMIAIALNWSAISSRLASENQGLSTVLTQGLDKAPLSSGTFRLHLWRFGLERWGERPLLGLGPGSTKYLLAQENSEALRNPNGPPFDHLHSGYFELLFQLGLIGALLFLACLTLLVRGLLRSYRDGGCSRELMLFLLGNFVLIAVYSLTDFRHLQWNWRFYWLIISGAALALTLLRTESEHA
jgi:O-antigen ligase